MIAHSFPESLFSSREPYVVWAVVAIQNVYAPLASEIGHPKDTGIPSSSPKKAKLVLLSLSGKPIYFISSPEETESMDR